MVELLVKKLEVQVVNPDDGTVSDWLRVVAMQEYGQYLVHTPDAPRKLKWVDDDYIVAVRYDSPGEGEGA
jgi:hypothetical protein